MKLLLVAPYPHSSADTRYRIEQFIPALNAAGILTELRPFMSERLFKIYADHGHLPAKAAELAQGLARRAADVVAANRYDLIFVHKEAFAFGPPWLEGLFKRRSGRLVYDLDDAFWTHPPQFRQIGRWLRDPRKTEKVLRLSNHIVAGNQYIAEHARQYNPAVSVVPTVIDTTQYRPRAARPTVDRIVIGWVGRWSSDFYLDTLEPVLKELCGRYPNVEVRLIGARPKHWPGVRVTCPPWQLTQEIEQLGAFDIGIMPLEDDDYARHKCGFKMLQYMGLALPVVVSPVGVNRDIIRHGQNGLLANTPSQWYECLAALVENAELRARLGCAGRRTIEADYSLAKAAPMLIDILRRVSEMPRA